MTAFLKLATLAFALLSVSAYDTEEVDIRISFIGKTKECVDKCTETQTQKNGFCQPTVNVNGCEYTFVKDSAGNHEKTVTDSYNCKAKCVDDHPEGVVIEKNVKLIKRPKYCN